MKSYFLAAVVAILVLSSCGTLRINKTSDFGKINDLSELNGTYRNKESKGEGISLMQFFDSRKENVETVTINFSNDSTLLVSYLDGNSPPETIEIKGKKRNKFFEVYYKKEQFIIPLIYSRVSVSRIRVGRHKKTNNLLIRNLSEQNGNILIICGGYGGEKPYVYENAEE